MGVIGFFLTILVTCFGTLAKVDKLSFTSAGIGWDKFFSEAHYIFCFIGVYVFGLLINLCMILINFYLTPSYNGIGDTLSGIFTMIKVIIKKKIYDFCFYHSNFDIRFIHLHDLFRDNSF